MAADATIGTWTETQLAKYIRDSVNLLAPDNLTSLMVDDLTVVDSLTVSGSVNMGRKLLTVGVSGSPVFTNGWVPLLGGYAPPAFWIDENGIVYLEGAAKSGTVGTTAWVLPPGYRPDQSRIFPAFSNNVGGLVQVTSGGLVQPLAVGTASNASYFFDGIMFRTTKT